jgi:hypothetical protein
MNYSRHIKYFLFVFLLFESCNKIDIVWDLHKVPEIETEMVQIVNAISIKCGGKIFDDGGSPITERGVCYSRHNNPTLNDTIVNCGSGNGSFTTNIIGLTPGTSYFLKAYAINKIGTGYGQEVNVYTTPFSLTTNQVYSITQTTAISGGYIMSDGGAPIIARGVCWSTSANPSITDSKTINGTGKGYFNSTISGLTSSTTYYVRAYATNSYMTAYGNELTFTTNGN